MSAPPSSAPPADREHRPDGDRVPVEIGDKRPPGIPEAATTHVWSLSTPPSRFGQGTGPGAQTGSRRSPPWAAMAQITTMSRLMISSDQNG